MQATEAVYEDMRIVNARAASFGADAMYNVTGVRAPW